MLKKKPGSFCLRNSSNFGRDAFSVFKAKLRYLGKKARARRPKHVAWPMLLYESLGGFVNFDCVLSIFGGWVPLQYVYIYMLQSSNAIASAGEMQEIVPATHLYSIKNHGHFIWRYLWHAGHVKTIATPTSSSMSFMTQFNCDAPWPSRATGP